MPGRTNIIVTRKKSAPESPGSSDALVAHDLDAAIALAADHDRMKHHRDEIFILGGSQIFREALPRADRMYLTLIEADIEGDVLFPEFDRSKWKLINDEAHVPDEKNPHPYRFQVLEQVHAPASPA